MPTLGDREFCRPGEELRTFRHLDVTFGCLICNDLWVTPGCGPYPDPRLAYHLGKKGAQGGVSRDKLGFERGSHAVPRSNLALRAMESQFHIVTANAAGSEGSGERGDGRHVTEGEWLTQCPRTGEHTYSIDIEVDTD